MFERSVAGWCGSREAFEDVGSRGRWSRIACNTNIGVKECDSGTHRLDQQPVLPVIPDKQVTAWSVVLACVAARSVTGEEELYLDSLKFQAGWISL